MDVVYSPFSLLSDSVHHSTMDTALTVSIYYPCHPLLLNELFLVLHLRPHDVCASRSYRTYLSQILH